MIPARMRWPSGALSFNERRLPGREPATRARGSPACRETATPAGRQCVEHGGHHGLRCGDAARLPRALDAQRIGVGRPLDERDVERRKIAGARHGVVHERAAQKLPRLRIVDRVLQHRLADALRDAALHLAFGEQRIDQPAVIVDGGVAHQGRDAGLGIDLDLGDVAAAGKGEDIRHVHHMLAQSGSHAVGQVPGIARAFRHGHQVDTAIGAAHDEAPSREIELVRAGLQEMCREPARFRQHSIDRLDHRRAAHMHGTCAAMAGAALHRGGVGLHIAERRHRQAEPVGGDLGIGRLMALAVGLGADGDRHPAVTIEAQLGAFVGRAARGLEEAADAEAA